MPEIAGAGALYADPDDPASIAVGLEKLLRDDVLHTRLSKAALANAKRFSLERTAEAMEVALNEAFDARRRHR